MLSINTNMMSLMAQSNLSKSSSMLDQSMDRLSSGKRINSAKDDAAGMALATKFTTSILASNMKIQNVGDGISFAQTAEAALGEVANMAQRILALEEQKAGGIVDAAPIDLEIAELVDEMNSQLGEDFNGTAVNGGTVTVDGVTVGGSATIPAATAANAQAVLDAVVVTQSELGAQSNRLESRARFLTASVEATESARSRIMDADMAKETANLAKYQILQQAGIAMLSQANSMPQLALSLLR